MVLACFRSWFITLLYGSLNAVKQTDLKALLPIQQSVSLGLIMSLLGLDLHRCILVIGDESTMYAVAVFAAIFHLVNHSTFKGCLFMLVGIIDHETGTRDIRKLGGLMNLMPITFTLTLIGSFSMAGIPPFNGFLSKEMFFTGVLNASKLNAFNMDTYGMLFPIIAWIASVFTFIYSMILVFKHLAGKFHQPTKLEKSAHEPSIGMLIPPMILAALVILIFFFPNVLAKYIIQPAFTSILPAYVGNGGIDIKISAWHGWNVELWMTIGVIVMGTLLFLSIRKWIALYFLYPQSLTLNQMYDVGLRKWKSCRKKRPIVI